MENINSAKNPMTAERIVKYVCETPYNPNPNVLYSMLQEFKEDSWPDRAIWDGGPVEGWD